MSFLGGTVDASESEGQPPGMVLKPVINNGMSTTNLNRFSRRMSEPSTVCVSLVMSRYEQNKVRGPVLRTASSFWECYKTTCGSPHDQLYSSELSSKQTVSVSCGFHGCFYPENWGAYETQFDDSRTSFFSSKWAKSMEYCRVSPLGAILDYCIRHRNFMEH